MEKKQKGILEGLSFTQHLLSATGKKHTARNQVEDLFPRNLESGGPDKVYGP